MRSVTRSLTPLIVLAFGLSAQADPPKLQQDGDATSMYSLAAREAQHQALSAIPGVEVKYGTKGRVRQIDGKTGIRVANAERLKRGDSVEYLHQKLKPILLANGSESLSVHQAGRMPDGGSFLMTNQVIDGIPVLDARVNFLLDHTGEIQMMNSLFVPQGKARSTPQLSLLAARAKLSQSLGVADISTTGYLAYWTNEGADAPVLLWMIDATTTSQGTPQTLTYGVDSATGSVRYNIQTTFGLNRTVYTNNNRTDFVLSPNNLLWIEGAVPNPADAYALNIYNRVVNPVQAWWGTPFHYDVMNLVAHHGSTNSSYHLTHPVTGASALFFGNNRALDDDAIAHEYGHGNWVNHVPGQPLGFLLYADWFALNEFYADFSTILTGRLSEGLHK